MYTLCKSLIPTISVVFAGLAKNAMFVFLYQLFHHVYTKYFGVQIYKLKKDVYKELSFFALFINSACVLKFENIPFIVPFTLFFNTLIILAFLKESIIISNNLQKQGYLVEDGIIMFKKSIFKEYLSILKVKSMNLDINYNTRETQGFNIKQEKRFSDYTDFFYHKWFFILHQT
ncbi:MAG: hypothetical protein ACFFCS_13765, partial [Candidatus Hodarchaeota archaeon]